MINNVNLNLFPKYFWFKNNLNAHRNKGFYFYPAGHKWFVNMFNGMLYYIFGNTSVYLRMSSAKSLRMHVVSERLLPIILLIKPCPSFLNYYIGKRTNNGQLNIMYFYWISVWTYYIVPVISKGQVFIGSWCHVTPSEILYKRERSQKWQIAESISSGIFENLKTE